MRNDPGSRLYYGDNLAVLRGHVARDRLEAHHRAQRRGHWGRNTNTILFYARGPQSAWTPQYSPYGADYSARFRNTDPDGRRWTDDNLTAKGLSGGGYTYDYKGVTSLWRMPPETMRRLDREGRLHFTKAGGIRLKRYLDESKGLPMQALWTDVPALNSQAHERLGYPTQKPLALLERITAASSEGNVVLDPFCGCGTAIHGAQKLGRRWIGIDVTHLAITLIEKRMRDAFPRVAFTVEGTPKDLASAEDLARRDKYQFQWWAMSMVDAMPFGGRKKARTAASTSSPTASGPTRRSSRSRAATMSASR